MTTMTVTARLARRWPTALALAAVAGCGVVVFRLSVDVEMAAGIATMMGVYPAAYAIGKPAAAWPAFGVLVLVALGLFVVGVDVGLGMTAVLVLLWVWALTRGLREHLNTRSSDSSRSRRRGLAARLGRS